MGVSIIKKVTGAVGTISPGWIAQMYRLDHKNLFTNAVIALTIEKKANMEHKSTRQNSLNRMKLENLCNTFVTKDLYSSTGHNSGFVHICHFMMIRDEPFCHHFRFCFPRMHAQRKYWHRLLTINVRIFFK